MELRIEKAAPGHVAALPAIERAAARLFEGRVPPAVIGDATPEADFHEARREGLLWVALVAETPVGFALAGELGASLHLEEMDVHPDHGRRGIGRALVEAVCAEAHARGFAQVTLTTYRSFEWNLPFYTRLGFTEVAPGTLPQDLAAIVRAETARGLDPAKRAVLRRAVAGT